MSNQNNKGGGRRRNRNRKGKQADQDSSNQQQRGPKKAQQEKQQKGNNRNQRKQKEKVSGSDGRKRKTRGGATKGQKANIAQARLQLIIRSKFQNPGQPQPTKLESRICQLLVDLEATNTDLKPFLRDLGIVSAREIAITPTKKAVVIFVPFAQHSRWQKLQERLVKELEKKFNDQDVLFIAQRKVMKLCQINLKTNAPRPRTQTITAVQNEILNDVVFPTKIVGKRTRFRVGGRRLLKVYLDPKDATNIEARLPTYEQVYRKLTRKNVKFLFPRYVI